MVHNFLFVVMAATMFLLSSASAFSATVEKVSKGDTVILKLSKKELERVSEGDEVVLKTSDGDVDAEVQELSGNKAKVYVVFGIDKLAEGTFRNAPS